ncbi:hypothetical protein ACIQUM_33950 [Amycolatopsis azurea]|uniref:hypothetical protein n=1 Tax=Amycolatopsis azurea TaxID=36819 RepID=UPI0038276D39
MDFDDTAVAIIENVHLNCPAAKEFFTRRDSAKFRDPFYACKWITVAVDRVKRHPSPFEDLPEAMGNASGVKLGLDKVRFCLRGQRPLLDGCTYVYLFDAWDVKQGRLLVGCWQVVGKFA